ncbi:unnamed protein product [Mytilus edulis]|uniref:Uncharacterized protein n=1 Tax=Mytilus edulis TaxID=6550 RepID=A0A8S3QAT3_MYTED|nr:unnamed protein product [Mytilus edulis]
MFLMLVCGFYRISESFVICNLLTVDPTTLDGETGDLLVEEVKVDVLTVGEVVVDVFTVEEVVVDVFTVEDMLLLKDTDVCIVVGLTVDINVLGDFELNVEEVVVDMFSVGELFGDCVDGTFAEVIVMGVLTLEGIVLVFVVTNVEDVVSEVGVDNSDVEEIRSV